MTQPPQQQQQHQWQHQHQCQQQGQQQTKNGKDRQHPKLWHASCQRGFFEQEKGRNCGATGKETVDGEKGKDCGKEAKKVAKKKLKQRPP
jgi:hypothetical protein